MTNRHDDNTSGDNTPDDNVTDGGVSDDGVVFESDNWNDDDWGSQLGDRVGAELVVDGIGTHRGGLEDFGRDAFDDEAGFLDRSFRERIVLVGMTLGGQSQLETEASLDELALLVDTAGADAIDRLTQRRDRPDPATFVGKGKATEIKEAAVAIDADTVVFDDELSPAQQYNLEGILDRTALDRTAVILDIFAQHATSTEGKTQVELAQLRYRLPRLRGKKNFSQQGGGIGTRGPGETQLEVDRRRLVRRMHKLERDLVGISARRANQRKARHRSPYRTISIVGYTNAGKSTLLNRLTGSEVKTEDRLFATVDPTTRKTQLPGGERVLFTDTVGFVRKLPHQLVESFKSTLEVAGDADLLIHVVDGTAIDPQGNIDAVRQVLSEIDAEEVAELLVFNKADGLDSDGHPGAAHRLARQHPGSVAISAHTGEGSDELFQAIAAKLREQTTMYELFVPWSRGDMLAAAHREGEVVTETSEDDGMRIIARLEDASAKRLGDFIERRVPEVDRLDADVSGNDLTESDVTESHLPEDDVTASDVTEGDVTERDPS